MHYIVYKITNLINAKFYIGVHKTLNLNDGYMGSGVLIKKAILKYGPQNFKKEILKEFTSLEEAVKYEAELVTKDFVLEDNNYNIALGGNVRSMPGKNNPFYDKKHSDETKIIISQKASGRIKYTNTIIIDDIEIPNAIQALNHLNITSKIKLFDMIGDQKCANIRFKDHKLQKKAEELFFKKQIRKQENDVIRAESCSKRFKNKSKSDEFKKNISEKLKGIKHSEEWTNKINKNPEKIRKTAEKHRGMKRSAESRKKMSESAKNRPISNKGKKYYTNPNNVSERNYFFPGQEPTGWINKVKI